MSCNRCIRINPSMRAVDVKGNTDVNADVNVALQCDISMPKIFQLAGPSFLLFSQLTGIKLKYPNSNVLRWHKLQPVQQVFPKFRKQETVKTAKTEITVRPKNVWCQVLC